MCTMIVNVHAVWHRNQEIIEIKHLWVCECVCMCLVVDEQEYFTYKKKIFALPIYKYTVRNNPITIRSFGGSFNPGNQHWSNIPIWYHFVVFLFFSSSSLQHLVMAFFGNYFKHIFVRYVMPVFQVIIPLINWFYFLKYMIQRFRLSKRLMGEKSFWLQ